MEDEEGTKAGYQSLRPWSQETGGFRACMFIFVFTALENMGFVANMTSMVLYFYLKMHFDISGSANTLTNLLGSTFLLSLFGGFISDTWLSRLKTCLIFGFLEILGLVMVSVQAYSEDLQPEACGRSSCVEGGRAFMFYASLSFLAIGSGGVKGALPALGADQFDHKDVKEAKGLASYFNWLLLSTTLGAVVGVTGIVWVSTNRSWFWGFFISTVATFLGFVVLALGKPFYRLQPPSERPITRITQVIAAAVKNRRLPLPESPDELYESNDAGAVSTSAEKIAHTPQFRCLDKAAIVQRDAKPSSGAVCTVTQVEEVKILTRMLPILGSTIIMNTCLAQLQTFSVQQGNTMNPYLGSLKVPAPSIPVIPLFFLSILVPLYEFVFVPLARKMTHHPSGITPLQRVGVGLVLSVVSMAIAGIVEVKRRNQAMRSPGKPISLFWLSFQYGIFGIADMFTLVGLMEFFYREAPAGMRSLSTSFTYLSLSFGYFLSTAFVSIINLVSKRLSTSKRGWLHGLDINSNSINLFYWFLAVLSCINFVNYVWWASWYKYKTQPHIPKPKRQTSRRSLLRSQESAEDVASKVNGIGASSAEQADECERKSNASL